MDAAILCSQLATDDAATDRLERRWFAAGRAAAELQAECDTLRDVSQLAQASLRAARVRLYQLQTLRDSLGQQLAELEDREMLGTAVAQSSAS